MGALVSLIAPLVYCLLIVWGLIGFGAHLTEKVSAQVVSIKSRN